MRNAISRFCSDWLQSTREGLCLSLLRVKPPKTKSISLFIIAIYRLSRWIEEKSNHRRLKYRFPELLLPLPPSLLPLSRSLSLDRAITIHFDSFFFFFPPISVLSRNLTLPFFFSRSFKLYYLPFSLSLLNSLCILRKIFVKDFLSSELLSQDLLIYPDNNVIKF